jgi:hypothetical protein
VEWVPKDVSEILRSLFVVVSHEVRKRTWYMAAFLSCDNEARSDSRGESRATPYLGFCGGLILKFVHISAI